MSRISKIFSVILFTIISSCTIQKEIINSKEMINPPQVVIFDKFVSLKVSSSGRKSASFVYEVKYNLIYNKSIIEFYGLEGIKFIGASKDSVKIAKRKFKNTKPDLFTYYYINPNGTKVKIIPIIKYEP